MHDRPAPVHCVPVVQHGLPAVPQAGVHRLLVPQRRPAWHLGPGLQQGWPFAPHAWQGLPAVSPRLTVLNLRPEHGLGRRAVLIAVDNIDPVRFRQLRVWLRWRCRAGRRA